MGSMILMPEELTAENGAKSLLIGEFFETRHHECRDCEGDGCFNCDYKGEFIEKIPVSWTTIKAIYRMAVKKYGKPVPNHGGVVSDGTMGT